MSFSNSIYKDPVDRPRKAAQMRTIGEQQAVVSTRWWCRDFVLIILARFFPCLARMSKFSIVAGGRVGCRNNVAFTSMFCEGSSRKSVWS